MNEVKNLNPKDLNKNKIFIMLGILVVVVIIVIVAFSQGKKTAVNNTPVNTPAANKNTPTAEQTAAQTAAVVAQNNALKDSVVVVPGANSVTKDNKVITSAGEVTKTDVSAASALAPQQTLAVTKESLPASVIKFDVTKLGGFAPNSFTVKAGAPVTVSITNKDSANSVTLGFTDPALVGVVLGAGPSETRAITFNAPTKAGEYNFVDGIPGHSGTGKMIVK